jgi:hypothetical protein
MSHMAQNQKKEPAEVILLPVGRLINESLFELDTYEWNGKTVEPGYTAELAFDPGALEDIENKLADAAAAEWSESAYAEYDNGQIVVPIKSGDDMARKREANGKAGDAYKGKDVIRANTQFNKFGQSMAPGGVAVYGPDAQEITIQNRQDIYSGCFGQAAVTIATYLTNDGKRALKFYLCGFQKTADGEKLVSPRDLSTVFKPVGRTEGAPVTRRRRAG